MKIIKYAIPFFAFAISIGFLTSANAAQSNDKGPAKKQDAGKKETSKDIEDLKDPFQSYAPRTDGGFINSNSQTIPSGIKVLGILIVENKKPLAALQVPNSDEPLYVRENDIVGVEVSAKNQNNKSTAEIIYLKIEKITSQQVIVTPKNNPKGKQILR